MLIIMYYQVFTSVLFFTFWGFVLGAEPNVYSVPNITTISINGTDTRDRVIRTYMRINYQTRAPGIYFGRMDANRRFSPLIETTPTFSLLHSVVFRCPDRDGWFARNGFCYFFTSKEASFREKKSWRDARKYCVQQGGDLLSIEDSDESRFISQYIRKFADILLWIGGRAEFVGSFKWSDGKPFLFNNWNVNEPNSVMGQEDCLSLYRANGKWNDDNCGRSLNFICKKPRYGNYTSNAVVKPIGHTTETKGHCFKGFSKAGGKCFTLVMFTMSFENARDFCRKFFGGELASINSQFEQDVISSLFWDVQINIDYVWIINMDYVWIGMKYMNGFLWLDQSTVDYTNWNKGEPNNNGFVRKPHIWNRGPYSNWRFDKIDSSLESKDTEECVELFVKTGYMWHDGSCNRKSRFICQKTVDSTLDFDPNIEFCKYPHNDFVKKGDGCYKVIDEQKSWKEAEEFCLQLGSNLMSIEFLEENNFIYTSLLSNYTSDDRFWMGMKYNNKTQSFKFSDENPVLFTNWEMDANDSCVVLSVSDNGKWYSESCSKDHKFICKYSPTKYILEGPVVTGSCPSEQWIDFHGEYCYLFETEEKADWMNANIRCIIEGGNLASIHSKQEGNLLKNFIKRNYIQSSMWIGLVRSGHSFFWSDGTPMDYQNWASGEPNDVGSGCGETAHFSDKWNDNDCDELTSYVCKISKIVFNESTSTTEEYSSTAIPTDESHSENKISSEISKYEYQPKNPTTTIIVCLSSISLLVIVSVMAYKYIRNYRMCRGILRFGAIDESVHYHGDDDEDKMILS